LHSEPDGDAHENLVGGKDGGLPGESERSGLPDNASKEASDDEGKGNLRTCWNGDRTEGRGGRKQRKRAQKRPENLTEPARELGIAEGQQGIT
jgi:hypothetical protein